MLFHLMTDGRHRQLELELEPLERQLLELGLLERKQLDQHELEQQRLELLELELLHLERRQLEQLQLGLTSVGAMSLGWRMLVFALVAATAGGAGTAIVLSAGEVHLALSDHTGGFAAFLAAAVVLQLLSVRVPGRGSVSVSAAALVGAAIALGTGPAMAIAGATALAQWLRSRGLAHRAVFDSANYVLSAGAAGVVFDALAGPSAGGGARLAAALLAGLAYTVTNHGLLCAAMASSEARSPLAIWRDRFSWASLRLLAFGPLGLLAATADAQLGPAALAAFLVPSLLLAHSMRAALTRVHPQQVREDSEKPGERPCVEELLARRCVTSSWLPRS
jgi:hypothetical protein